MLHSSPLTESWKKTPMQGQAQKDTDRQTHTVPSSESKSEEGLHWVRGNIPGLARKEVRWENEKGRRQDHSKVIQRAKIQTYGTQVPEAVIWEHSNGRNFSWNTTISKDIRRGFSWYFQLLCISYFVGGWSKLLKLLPSRNRNNFWNDSPKENLV